VADVTVYGARTPSVYSSNCREGAGAATETNTALLPQARRVVLIPALCRHSAHQEDADGFYLYAVARQWVLLNGPRWVAVERSATLSPSASMSLMTFRVSGKAES
jgi:hypothetical protein